MGSPRPRGRFSVSLVALATALFFIPGVPAAVGVDVIEVNCPGDSLQAAIDAADSGSTFEVSGICVENLVLDKDLRIEGSGGRLDGGRAGSVAHVLPGVVVSITDISVDNGVAEYGAGILNEGGLDIDSVSFSNNVAFYAGGAIHNSGELAVWDSYFDNNSTIDDGGDGGGAGVFNSGVASIGFSGFIDNSSPDDSGGGVFNLGEISIYGESFFTGNHSERGGAAIANGYESYADPVGMVLTDVYMFDNSGLNAGALSSLGPLTGTNLTFGGNSSDSGPTMLVAGGTAVLNGAVFDGNDGRKGGGVRVEVDGHLAATGLQITGNRATEGGGISVDGGLVELSDSDVTQNTSSIGGGGIALRNGATLVGSEIVISQNSANANGGGILAKSSTIELADSEISYNLGNYGGGIANAVGSTASLVRTAVASNTADHYGGGIFNAGSEAWITESTIGTNSASVLGGGVSNIRGADAGRVYLTNSTVARNSAPEGSGIHNSDVFVALDHVTITENFGGVGFWEDKSPLWTTPTNSIIAGNPGGDCSSMLHSAGGNVVGDCRFGDDDGEPIALPTDLIDVADPALTPIVGPDGFVSHYVPEPGSPAVNRVPLGACTQPADQIGSPRPMGAGCDSGSIEADDQPTELSIDADFEFGHVFGAGDLSLTGTALDDSEVTRVKVGVKDRNQGLWLQDDLVSWGSFNMIRAQLASPGSAATVWSLDVELANGSFSLAARAFDDAGNHVDIVPYRHFGVAADVAAPVVDADFADLTIFSSPVTLTGTATDDVAVDVVKVAIRDRVTKLWLQSDKVTWGSSYHGFIPTMVGFDTPELTWTFEVELPDGKYSLSARARDEAGQWGEMAPWRRFNVAS